MRLQYIPLFPAPKAFISKESYNFALGNKKKHQNYGNLYNHIERAHLPGQGSGGVPAGAGSADAQGGAQVKEQLPAFSGGQVGWAR